MKAVLVGGVDSDKIYYILDAGPDDLDGAMERPDGSIVKFDLFPFVTKTRSLKKIRTTRFHRYLWDNPRENMANGWKETFIKKVKPLSENMLKEVNILTAIGKNKKKIQSKNESIDRFVKELKVLRTKTAPECCQEMVQSKRGADSFRSELKRKQAWVARIVLNDLNNIKHK